jgi:RHS repeat-associated protein
MEYAPLLASLTALGPCLFPAGFLSPLGSFGKLVAYAPYGEDYNGSGTMPDLAFTDQNQDTVKNGWSSNLYDFLMREYRTAHGRWTSPDPAGMGAVNPANPQSWNRYGYVVNNPLALTDPSGLDPNCDLSWMGSCDNHGPTTLWGADGRPCASIDGAGGSCSMSQSLVSSDVGVKCPGNVCNGWIDGQYAQFYAFSGGVSGYFQPSSLNDGINIIGGRIYNDANYNGYIQQTYADRIDAQRQELARRIAANSGGTISYQQAYNSLSVKGGHLQGGNYNFEAIDGLGPNSLDCGNARCNGVHFPGQDQNGNWFVHLDTSNPFTGPVGFFEHGFVDLLLGNVAYTVIPRPWP